MGQIRWLFNNTPVPAALVPPPIPVVSEYSAAPVDATWKVVSRLMWKSAERIFRLVSNTLLTRPT
jgi:hypothetical protein